MLNLQQGLLDASRGHQLETVRVPEDVQSINAAIQSCASGGQVLISPGTYDEPVLLDRDVQLIGVRRLPALHCVFTPTQPPNTAPTTEHRSNHQTPLHHQTPLQPPNNCPLFAVSFIASTLIINAMLATTYQCGVVQVAAARLEIDMHNNKAQCFQSAPRSVRLQCAACIICARVSEWQ